MIFIWLIIYGFIYRISERASFILNLPHIITVFTMLLYWAVLVGYLYKKEHLKMYGLCLPEHKRFSRYAACIPLLLFPIMNMLMYEQNYIHDWGILLLLSASFGEEILFRGFLLSKLTEQYRKRPLYGIAVTSCLFAVMHMVNLYTGVTLRYAAVQTVCAGAMGVCFAVISYRDRSIIPSVILHSLINVTSPDPAGGSQMGAGLLDLGDLQAAVFLIMSAIYFMYGIWLYRKEIKKVLWERKNESIH